MKHLIYSSIAILFLMTSSCKKDDDNEPQSPSFNTNPPPTSGSYFVGQTRLSDQGESFAGWTTDFVNYFNFTDEFKNVSKVNVDDGTVIITQNQDQSTALYFIRLAPVDNLTSFTKVSSIYYPDIITVLNGTVYAYSSILNRFGTCKTTEGQTDISWNEISASNDIRQLKAINGDVMGEASVNGNSAYVHITNNGASINFNVSAFDASIYDYFDGKTWGLHSENWGTITTNDWANGTWETGSFDARMQGNTTNISGLFMSYGYPIQVINSEFRIYGYIQEDDGSSITNHACVNISTDNGQTWKTHLMSAIPKGDAYTIPYYSEDITVLHYQEQTMNTWEIYSSTDGINFEKWEDQSRISNYESMTVFQKVRE